MKAGVDKRGMAAPGTIPQFAERKSTVVFSTGQKNIGANEPRTRLISMRNPAQITAPPFIANGM